MITAKAEFTREDGTWRTSDDQTFSFRRWRDPSTAPRASLILIHGLNGAMTDLEPLLPALVSNRLQVYAYDLRGQGSDPIARRRGDLSNWRRLPRDLAEFADLVRGKSALPLFLYGESMGALIALHATAAIRPAGLICASPVVRFREALTLSQRGLAFLFCAFLPYYRPDLRRLIKAPKPRVTRDEAYQASIEHAPHKIERFTLRFYNNLIAMVGASFPAARLLRVPTLVLAAGQDAFVTAEAVTEFFRAVGASDKELRCYPESYHLLVRDFGAEQVLFDITQWLSRQLGAFPG